MNPKDLALFAEGILGGVLRDLGECPYGGCFELPTHVQRDGTGCCVTCGPPGKARRWPKATAALRLLGDLGWRMERRQCPECEATFPAFLRRPGQARTDCPRCGEPTQACHRAPPLGPSSSARRVRS